MKISVSLTPKQHVLYVTFPTSLLHLLTITLCYEYWPFGVTGRAFGGVIYPGTIITLSSMKNVKPRLQHS